MPFWKDSLESKHETTMLDLEAVVWAAWEEQAQEGVQEAMTVLLRDWGWQIHGDLGKRLRDAGWTCLGGVWTPAPEDNLRLVGEAA